MGKVVASAAMSLDGFMADSRGSVERLYPDLGALRRTDVLQESVRRTGAVLMGRRTYAMGDPDSYLGDYEYQVPIFVVTHEIPERQPKQGGKLTFTFVTDGIRSAVRQARAVSGEKSVTIVGGGQHSPSVPPRRSCRRAAPGYHPCLVRRRVTPVWVHRIRPGGIETRPSSRIPRQDPSRIRRREVTGGWT